MLGQETNEVPSRIARRGEKSEFRAAILQGLSLSRKRVPSTFFYDAEGAKLFVRICGLPEYYLTRSEVEILRCRAADIASFVPDGAIIVEFGSGRSRKVDILLDHLVRPASYVPIDVSPSCLSEAKKALNSRYPQLPVVPIEGDFTQWRDLGALLPPGPRVGFFPGSTIGNFHPAEAAALLRHFTRMLGPGSQLIVGVDLKKDVTKLHAAYNDAAGITADFNLNLLRRANKELSADFSLSKYVHRAPYNRAAGRIEMHLVSTIGQTVKIDGKYFSFHRGESIHTENSYKYEIEQFAGLASSAGMHVQRTWSDRQHLFSVNLLCN